MLINTVELFTIIRNNMNSIKVSSLLVLSFCVCFSYKIHAQTLDPKSYKLFVNLENAPFDSLYLHDYTLGRDILIAGKKTKEFTWEITIPDTIVWDSENMELLASPYDSKSNSLESIRFVTKREGKKVIVVNVGVEDKNNYIDGSYLDTVQFSNEQIIIKIGNKHSKVAGNLICTDFNLVIKDPNSDIAIRAQDPFFSWFMNSNNEAVSYNSHLASYIDLSKKYPDSRFLMINLAGDLTRYKSKDDVKKIYENFSEKHKNTIWAKNIERFLYDQKFQNTSLPTVRSNTYENIVQDSSKYNLVIFSASWCEPCIKEIPLLKKIYKDLGKNLILTFVSIDNAQGVTSFQKLIREKKIPWHSLFAYQDVKKIREKYFIEGIPHNILIYPNQDTEIIDVRKNEDRVKLYSVVKSHENQKKSIK